MNKTSKKNDNLWLACLSFLLKSVYFAIAVGIIAYITYFDSKYVADCSRGDLFGCSLYKTNIVFEIIALVLFYIFYVLYFEFALKREFVRFKKISKVSLVFYFIILLLAILGIYICMVIGVIFGAGIAREYIPSLPDWLYLLPPLVYSICSIVISLYYKRK